MLTLPMLNLSRSVKTLVAPMLGTALVVTGILISSETVEMRAQSFAPVLPLPQPSFGLPPVAELTKTKPSPLKNEVIGYLRTFDKGSDGDRAKAIATLRQRATAMGPALHVALRLSIARTLAGLSLEGRRLRPPSPRYREALLSASQIATRLPAADRAWVLRYALAVWQKAEGRALAWDKLPVTLKAFAALPEAKAIVERVALQDLKKDRFEAAHRKYEALARSFAGTPTKASLDLRVLDLKRVAAQKVQTSRLYEQALVKVSKDYLDPGVLGAGNEARAKTVFDEIEGRYRSLVLGTLQDAARPRATARERASALALGERYFGSLREGPSVRTVKEKLADVYYLAGRPARAVVLYKELAGAASSPEEKRFVALAIRSQSVLASWPTDVPWQGVKRGLGAAREELLGLYKSLQGEKQKGHAQDWFILAHVGLLEIEGGQAEEAFKGWTEQLGVSSQGPHAAQAAGYMLTAYEKAGQFGALENTARLCLTQGVTPLYRKAPLHPQNLLALALLEGGKEALQGQNYQVAVSKLEEVVKQHGAYRKHDEGLYLLALAYRGLSRHDESIKARVAFVERYAQSPYYREALLTGGAWSSAMAYEENTIFFKERFVHSFSKDAETGPMREQLVSLYLGRELYAEALRVLGEVARQAGSDDAVKAHALAQSFRIEEQHGSLERAVLLADRLLKTPGVPHDFAAQAYGLKARYLAKKAAWGEIDHIETQLAGLGDELSVREAVAEIRLRKAIRNSETIIQETFNLALKDPYATLNQRYQAFVRARGDFVKVCDTGATSFCVPAMTQLSSLATEFLKSTEEIEIQPTLSREVVGRFQALKQKVSQDGSATVQNSETKLAAAARDGYTSPDWVQAAEWQQNGDWNLDQLSGENGRGYVQWSEGVDP